MKQRYPIKSWQDGKVVADPEIFFRSTTSESMKLGLAVINVRADAIADSQTPIFWCADLRGANLAGDDLSGCDFSMADLSGASLFAADLRGCDFRNADLVDADLRQAKLDGAKFDGADLRGALLPADAHRHSFANAKIAHHISGPYRKSAA